MLEIEIKYAVADVAAMRSRLEAIHVRSGGVRRDADTYFNAPHRDFASTDEAFRVRQIGDDNYLTYKGPRIDPQTKTRREIEVPLASGPESAQRIKDLLIALGFRAVATVRKRRESFELTHAGFNIEITLDDVEKVGTYAELEIVAEESVLAPARSALLQLADELGLTQSERRSYLELLLAAEGARP